MDSPALFVGRCATARSPLRAHPSADAEQVSEALPGEPVDVLAVPSTHPGWARVRTSDGYAGWAPVAAVLPGVAPPGLGGQPLLVTALRAHAYAEPTVRAAIVGELCLGTRLWARPITSGPQARRASPEGWLAVTLPGGEHGWVGAAVVNPLPHQGTRRTRVVGLALRLLDTPYVWGGRSAWGLDCSGLVQLVWGACGIPLPRDSDEQQAAVEPTGTPARGDLAFFPGHVGIVLGEGRLVHANARHMRVTIDVFGDPDYGRMLADTCTGYGRLP